MLDDFFIIYTNNNFRDNPENLYKISDEIDPFMFPLNNHGSKNTLNFFIEELISISEINDPDAAYDLIPKWEDDSEGLPAGERSRIRVCKPDLEAAYKAAYWYQGHNCHNRCIQIYGHGLAKTAERLEYGGNRRLKCFECSQFFFRNFLTKFVKGGSLDDLLHPLEIDEEFYKKIKAYKPYLDVKIGEKISDGSGLERYIVSESNCVEEKIVFINDDEFYRKKFIKLNDLFDSDEYFRNPPKNSFNEFITSIVGYSLTNFLLNDKLAKLKKCHGCDKFFKASKNDKRIKFCPDCTSKSRKSKDERAEYQKQYRLKKKQDSTAQEREAKIMNYIDKLGCTREEALDIIEADSKP